MAEGNGKMRDFYENIDWLVYLIIIFGLLYAAYFAYRKERTGYMTLCLSLAVLILCLWLFATWKPMAGLSVPKELGF